MTIRVNQDDIDKGSEPNSTRDPITLAMMRALRSRIGEEGLQVIYAQKGLPGEDFFIVELSEFDTDGKHKVIRFSLPPLATDFYNSWKSGNKVRPTKFTVLNGRAVPLHFEWKRPAVVLLAFGTSISILLQVINVLR